MRKKAKFFFERGKIMLMHTGEPGGGGYTYISFIIIFFDDTVSLLEVFQLRSVSS